MVRRLPLLRWLPLGFPLQFDVRAESRGHDSLELERVGLLIRDSVTGFALRGDVGRRSERSLVVDYLFIIRCQKLFTFQCDCRGCPGLRGGRRDELYRDEGRYRT